MINHHKAYECKICYKHGMALAMVTNSDILIGTEHGKNADILVSDWQDR